MDISLVPIGQVAGLVPAILPFFKESEDWTRGRATVDDLLRFVLNGQMHLWVVHDEEKIAGHVMTEIMAYPQCKMLRIQYCAMTTGTLDEINEKMQDVAARFAKDAGCSGIEFIGRPGWRATAKTYGYNVQSVMYQKFFEETT